MFSERKNRFGALIGIAGIALPLCYIFTSIIAGGTQTPPAVPADWLTDGGNPQRTAWQKSETQISPASVSNLRLKWKVHLDNEPRQMHSLLPALIIGRVQTAAGLKQIVVVAGVSDNLYGIDADTGAQLWKIHFDQKFRPSNLTGLVSVLCPGGQTATPVIAPSGGKDQYVIYAVSWDGRLRQVDAATGREIGPPAALMPPNGKPYALNLWNGVLYTTTGQGCGGTPNLVYAYDLVSKKVSMYSPGGSGMWGRTGPSIGMNGTVFTGTGDGILDPARHLYNQAIIGVGKKPNGNGLELKDYFAPANAEWLYRHDLDMNVSGPVFTFHGREFIVQSSKECRLWLLDTASLGGPNHRIPVYGTPQFCNDEASFESAGVWGALASWEDAAGPRWVFAPFWGPPLPKFAVPIRNGPVTHGAIAAFRLEESNSELVLQPVWISRDLNMAEPPVISNGVLFAFGSGESTRQRWPDPKTFGGARGRIAESTHATLYALDAQTGRELWSSGDEIKSWSHSGGLATANGHVYLGTFDGFIYSFGISAKVDSSPN